MPLSVHPEAANRPPTTPTIAARGAQGRLPCDPDLLRSRADALLAADAALPGLRLRQLLSVQRSTLGYDPQLLLSRARHFALMLPDRDVTQVGRPARWLQSLCAPVVLMGDRGRRRGHECRMLPANACKGPVPCPGHAWGRLQAGLRAAPVPQPTANNNSSMLPHPCATLLAVCRSC